VVFGIGIVSVRAKTPIFPIELPVSWESDRRQVRSVLRRQRGSSARHWSVLAQPGQAQCYRKAAKWKASKDLALSDPSWEVCRMCFSDRL